MGSILRCLLQLKSEQSNSNKQMHHQKDLKQHLSSSAILPERCSSSLNSKKINKDQNSQKDRKLTNKWSVDENQIYLEFLEQYCEQISSQKDRRQNKIFKMMSNYMKGVRTPEQCRGHHKKLLEKYKTLESILKNLPKRNQQVRNKTFATELDDKPSKLVEKEQTPNSNTIIQSESIELEIRLPQGQLFDDAQERELSLNICEGCGQDSQEWFGFLNF